MTEKKLNILMIRLSSMGDVVLTTSLVRQLKATFPNSRIDFVTSQEFKEIYKYNPYISNLIEYDKSSNFEQIATQKNDIKQNLPLGKYDYVIDLQRNMRTKIFRSGLGEIYFLVHKRRLHKLSLVYLKKPLYKTLIPVPEVNRFCVRELDVKNDNKGLEIWLPEEKGLQNYPPEFKQRKKDEFYKIAIAPGAYHFTKRYPKERFVNLIELISKKINAEFYIIGGMKDKEITDYIKLNSKVNITDYSNSTSILETAKILNTMDVLITNDTGVMHIAASRKIPVLAIFGSTVKEFGFIPYGTDYRIAESTINCRPCTHIGRNECPRKHFDCMMNITVEKLVKELFVLLEINK
jgi:heptosyltransferase-2